MNIFLIKTGGHYEKINTYGFNFNEEIKDYKDLCKNKEKRKYRTYLDWKKHIVENLEGMNIQSLENFRHLCLYQEKTENRGKEVFLPLSIALFSLYLTQFAIRDQDFFAAVIGYTLAAIVVTVSVIFSYFSYAFPKDFYHDVAEITQEYINAFPEDEKKLLIAVKEIEVRK